MKLLRVNIPWTTLYADTGSASKKWIALHDFVSAGDIKWARLDGELLRAHADFRLLWGIQTALSESALDGALDKGTTWNGDGLKISVVLDVSSDTGAKKLARPGVQCWSNAVVPVLITARFRGVFEYGRG